MRVKLVEHISAVIGQCARRAIHIGRVEKMDAVVGRTRRVRNARLTHKLSVKFKGRVRREMHAKQAKILKFSSHSGLAP